MANIKTSAAELIGKTPLLEVKKFEAKENITDAKILAKLEYFNPAGSVKDRVALKMIEDAEESGKLKPEQQLLNQHQVTQVSGLQQLQQQRDTK